MNAPSEGDRHRSPPSRTTVEPPSARLRLRSARAADAPAIARHRAALFREMDGLSEAQVASYGRVFARWYRAELSAGRLIGRVVENRAARLVAEGLLWLQPRQPSPRFPHTALPYLFQVYTEPRYRGGGWATAVVASLVDWAKAEGYPRVALHATEAGRHIYERLGFTPTPEMRLELGLPSASPSDPARGGRRGTARTRPRGEA